MELQFRFLFYGKKSAVRARLQRAVLSLLARRPRCSAVTQLLIKISRTGPLVPVPVPLLVPVSFHSKNQKKNREKKVEKEKISVKMSMNLFRLAGDMTHVLSILVLLLRLQAAKNANGISLKTQELYLVPLPPLLPRLSGLLPRLSGLLPRLSGLLPRLSGLLPPLPPLLPTLDVLLVVLNVVGSRHAADCIITYQSHFSSLVNSQVVFVTRYLDLLTTYISLYNTIMKILYISATSYIIYMITNMDKVIPDRKSFDTFKTHYVYAVCAVLGLITNIIQGFDIIDVSHCYLLIHTSRKLIFYYNFIAVLDILNLLGISCNFTPINDVNHYTRGREPY